MSQIVKQGSMAGGGCAIQGGGCLVLLLALITIPTIIGPLILGPIGLWLLYYGSKKSSWCECSACGTKLAHDRVTVCPSCHEHFQ
jgi:hypothetical protein